LFRHHAPTCDLLPRARAAHLEKAQGEMASGHIGIACPVTGQPLPHGRRDPLRKAFGRISDPLFGNAGGRRQASWRRKADGSGSRRRSGRRTVQRWRFLPKRTEPGRARKAMTGFRAGFVEGTEGRGEPPLVSRRKNRQRGKNEKFRPPLQERTVEEFGDRLMRKIYCRHMPACKDVARRFRPSEGKLPPYSSGSPLEVIESAGQGPGMAGSGGDSPARIAVGRKPPEIWMKRGRK